MPAIVVKPAQSAVFERGDYATVYKMVYAESPIPCKTLFVGKTVIKPGGAFPLHRHPVEEVYYILSGSGYVEVDGEKSSFEAGDAVFVPAFSRHRPLNGSKTEALEFVAAAGITLSSCREKDIEKWESATSDRGGGR